ncbi:DUF1496 domain-containing protein [Vibrio sp. WXL103]|uniref:DUF1496 domain-containing protein n=1 Tax=unclassified Vibrio TaxID=2614977 RepID=UPI003EC6C7E3
MVGSKRSATLALIAACVCSGSALANSTVTRASVGNSANRPVVVVDNAQMSQRVCYYEGQKYSLGSIIETANRLLECQADNDFELNGALKWVLVSE